MKKRYIVMGLIVACLAVTYAVAATPGDDSDPVISLSYLNEIFKPEIKAEIQETATYALVELSAGQELVCDMGTELILRMGTAEVMATEMGGLSDVTSGYDIANSTQVPSNHHLIVPRDDGRGVRALSDCIFMVKGTYTMK